MGMLEGSGIKIISPLLLGSEIKILGTKMGSFVKEI